MQDQLTGWLCILAIEKEQVIWAVLNFEASEAVFPKAVSLRVKAASQIWLQCLAVLISELWSKSLCNGDITCPLVGK